MYIPIIKKNITFFYKQTTINYINSDKTISSKIVNSSLNFNLAMNNRLIIAKQKGTCNQVLSILPKFEKNNTRIM